MSCRGGKGATPWPHPSKTLKEAVLRTCHSTHPRNHKSPKRDEYSHRKLPYALTLHKAEPSKSYWLGSCMKGLDLRKTGQTKGARVVKYPTTREKGGRRGRGVSDASTGP